MLGGWGSKVQCLLCSYGIFDHYCKTLPSNLLEADCSLFTRLVSWSVGRPVLSPLILSPWNLRLRSETKPFYISHYAFYILHLPFKILHLAFDIWNHVTFEIILLTNIWHLLTFDIPHLTFDIWNSSFDIHLLTFIVWHLTFNIRHLKFHCTIYWYQ